MKEAMRIAVKVSSRRFTMLDVDNLYYLESEGHDTWLRTFRRTRMKSVRSLAALERILRPLGFVRIHRSYMINPDRVREVRMRQGDDNDWELKMDPPVNVVLPVGRAYLARLRSSLGF